MSTDNSDILDRPAPALNASGGEPIQPMPEAAAAPAPDAPETPETEQPDSPPPGPAAAAEPASESSEADAGEAEPAEPAPKEPRGVGKRLLALETQLREANERSDQLAAEARMAREALARVTPPTPTERPRAENFQTPAEYDAAMIAFGKTQGAMEAAQTQAQVTAAAAEHATMRTWEQRKTALKETMPDLETVISSPDVPIPLTVARAIVRSPEGPQIAYHLAMHPDEAGRIAMLTPEEQAYEVGRLAAERPWQRTARNVSSAPPPITPVGSRQRADRVSPEDESMEAYAARRLQEIRPRAPGTRPN